MNTDKPIKQEITNDKDNADINKSRIKEVEPTTEQNQPEPSPTCDNKVNIQECQDKDRPVRLFVGQVPDSMVEPHIVSLFNSKDIQLIDVAIIRDKNTGRHRHCAFVTVPNRAAADLAIKEFHNTCFLEAMANPMQVREANQPKSKAAYAKLREFSLLTGTPMPIFADSENEHIPKDSMQFNGRVNPAAFQQQHLMHMNPYFSPPYYQQVPPHFFYGYFPGPMPPHAYMNMPNYQENKYRKEMYMEDYRKKPWNEMSPQTSVTMSQNSKDDIKQPSYEPNGTVYFSPTGEPYSMYNTSNLNFMKMGSNYVEGPTGANLFVNNLPLTFTDDDLLKIFAGYGNILSCKVFIDRFTQKSKGFGFVSFGSVDEAQEAISEKNGYEIEPDRKILVELKRPRRYRSNEYFP